MQLFLSHELRIPGAGWLATGEVRGHMEERFTWAASRGHSVCALACEPIGLETLEERSPGLAAKALGALSLSLEPAFRASEAVVQRDAGEGRGFVVLLVGPDPARLEAACREWVGGARGLRVDGWTEPLRIGLKVGYAVTQPGKRLFLDTLIRVAREGLHVARCRGAGACVHTMLYDLLQDQLEHERGSQGLVITASVPLSAGAPPREPETEGQTTPRTETRPAVPAPPPPRVEPGHGVRDRNGAGPVAHALPDRSAGPTDEERRELLAALDAHRRENDALRARLQALEERDVVADGPSPSANGASVAPPVGAEDRDRIERLERLVAKLTLTLEEAEQRLASRRSDVDPGIASCYRTVQGLAPDESNRALKASLMQGIFEANLELLERLKTWRAQASGPGWVPGLEPGA